MQSSPTNDYGLSPTAAASADLLSAPSRFAATTLLGHHGAKLLSLHALVVDALEGVSFLSDQVANLGDDNERLRWENVARANALAVFVKKSRREVHSLPNDLVRMWGAPQLATFPPLPTLSITETKRPTPLTLRRSLSAPPLAAAASTAGVFKNSSRPGIPTQQCTPKHPVPHPLAFRVSEGTRLVAVNNGRPPKAVFVTKLVPSTTSAQVFAHLTGVGPAQLCAND